MSAIELKAIEELRGQKFFIPDYQRGYRWETEQVNDLLDDLEEFSLGCYNKNKKEIYCLAESSDFCLGEPYFWGEDINFSYNGKDYVWTADDTIEERIDDKRIERISGKASLQEVQDILNTLRTEPKETSDDTALNVPGIE